MKSRGFTLVEVMIASGLVGLISVGIFTVIMNFAKNNSRAAAREDIQDLNKILQLILMNENLCDRAMVAGGNAPIDFVSPTTPVAAILDPGNTLAPLVRSGDVFSRLQIGNITLERDPNDTNPPRQETMEFGPAGARTANTYTIYRVNLVVPISSRNASPSGVRDSYAPLTIPLRLYTLGGVRVARCQIATATNQTCSSLGATFDPAQGRCVFPICDANVINQQTARGLPNYACMTDGDCTAPVYYWGFYNDRQPVNAATNRPITTPVCICINSCIQAGY